MGHYDRNDIPVPAKGGDRFTLIYNRRDHMSTTYIVRDREQDDASIGEVMQYHSTRDPKGAYNVLSGGPGVKVDRGPYLTAHDAGMAIVAARETSAATKGEALHVDTTGLREIDRQILDFETAYPVWRDRGRKDTAIYDLFRIDSIRYSQMLQQLLDTPEAMKYAPQTVTRLLRLREQRHAARGGRWIA